VSIVDVIVHFFSFGKLKQQLEIRISQHDTNIPLLALLDGSENFILE
jgi:hypothetical protein